MTCCSHTPLAAAIPGLRRFEAARGFATPDGTAAPHPRIAELTFDDMDALQGGWARARERPRDDLQNFCERGVRSSSPRSTESTSLARARCRPSFGGGPSNEARVVWGRQTPAFRRCGGGALRARRRRA